MLSWCALPMTHLSNGVDKKSRYHSWDLFLPSCVPTSTTGLLLVDFTHWKNILNPSTLLHFANVRIDLVTHVFKKPTVTLLFFSIKFSHLGSSPYHPWSTHIWLLKTFKELPLSETWTLCDLAISCLCSLNFLPSPFLFVPAKWLSFNSLVYYVLPTSMP